MQGQEDIVVETVGQAPLASEHFIRWLDFGLLHVPGHSTLTTEVGDMPCDAGLIATIVDVIGGHLVMRERFPVLLATTHIELHGIDRLVGPGPLVAEANIIASSRRRVIVETSIRVGGMVALAHAGFAVREDLSAAAQDTWARERVGIVIRAPLWQQIGIEIVDGGARVGVHPQIHNHVGGLQGGAMVALLERGALLHAFEGQRVTDASINYLTQARSTLVRAVTAADLGDVVSIDGLGDGASAPFANAVFRLGPSRPT